LDGLNNSSVPCLNVNAADAPLASTVHRCHAVFATTNGAVTSLNRRHAIVDEQMHREAAAKLDA